MLPESSGASSASRLTPAELERAVRSADPAALLILPRILRRVIKQDRGLAGFGIKVPHRKSYVIGREALLEIVDWDELGLAEESPLPDRVALLPQPDSQELAAAPAEDVLLDCWRLLFHARVHMALDEQFAAGRLSPAVLRERIQQLGTAEFEEVRAVLSQEDMLLPPQSDASIYAEFVAVYLELRCFAGSLVPHYFPGIENFEAVDALVRRDVEADRLFWATRPQGAPCPHDSGHPLTTTEMVGAPEAPAVEPAPPSFAISRRKYRLSMRKAQRSAKLGNVVRAAICRARAARFAPPDLAARASAALRMDVYRLIRRLQAALAVQQTDSQTWRDSLFALVNQTSQGFWTAEARLLYDLQKACVDHEREIYTVDLVEWFLSMGRRPIKRQLPNQRDVLMLKHLRSAAKRLAVVRLSDEHRRQLGRLIRDAESRVESHLRKQLRPQIAAVLENVGLKPRNLPERVARKKLIEELLDQIAAHGFLTMGDLRDAISRSNLKLPDLLEARDLMRGDQLLRADRGLSVALDGVYRRGEFYLRWMQRLSALAFGTRPGRLFTRLGVAPFGGAYVALAGLREVWDMIVGAHSTAAEGFHIALPPLVLMLGLFLLGVINSAEFRRVVGAVFKRSYRAVRTAVVEPIRWIAQSPWLQRILHSRMYALTMRLLIKPLFWTCVVWWLLPREARAWQGSTGTAVLLFLAVNAVLNSRLGRNAEEVLIDNLVQGWHRFGLRVITGLFWFVVDVFKRIVETVERMIYSVDEWLRFRSGEGRTSLVAKAGLGFLWFFVSYVLRFAVNVLIEPQINPIKHFPVVTVAHKLLLGFYKPFADLLELKLGLDAYRAWIVATGTIWGIPGIFGFLVWELTSNWRLYAANRRSELAAVPIGSHGETMARLLKPGFHSGTLPKRFAKLRRAERHARSDRGWSSVRKHLLAAEEIEVALRRYVHREFMELLAESPIWRGPAVALREVRLGTNAVRFSLACPGLGDVDLRVGFEVESGWLMAGIVQPGWIGQLSPEQRGVLSTALIGLYKTAGIELVRQQIDGLFGPPAPWYDVAPAGLMLWPERTADVEVLYALDGSPWIAPQASRGLPQRTLPTVERKQLVFSEVSVAWNDWVEAWNQDAAGDVCPPGPVVPTRVLP